MAAFAISRMRFRGRNVVFVLLLAGIMVPADVLIIPIFQLLNSVGLLNTYWAVIFPQVSSVIALFVFKQFFDGLPRELEEAARLDGASNWRIYRSVDHAAVAAGPLGHGDRHLRRASGTT